MRVVPLLEVAPLASDRVDPFDGTRPYIATGGLDDHASLAPEAVTYAGRPSRADITVRPGDVCFARMQGTQKVLEVGVGHADLILSTGFAVLRPKPDRLHSGFLRHWLRTAEFQRSKNRLCSGATQKAITNGKIEELTIPLPRLDEQRRITEVLDRAGVLRASRRVGLTQLDTLIQSIFLELFADPLSNPLNWPQESLETYFQFRTGKLDSNAAVPEGQYPFFTCSQDDLRIDTYAFDCEALLLAGNNASADYSVKYYKGKFNAYQRTYVITLRDTGNTFEYARFVLEHRLAELKRISKGTNTKYLTLGLLNRIRVPVPPIHLQHEYARRVTAVGKMKATHGASLAEADALFESLQDRAFKGEL